MEIKNVKINDFKGLSYFELDEPKKCTAIIGANGKGKSSILDAVRVLVTGNVPANPVRSGQMKAIVSGNLCGYDIEYHMGAKNSVRLNGKATTKKSVLKLLEEETKVTSDTMEIATSSSILSAMNAGQLSDFLVGNKLIPAEITLEDLFTVCVVDAESKEILQRELPPAPAKFTLDDIGALYDKLFAERTVLKQKLKEQQALANYTEAPPVYTLTNVNKELDKLKTHQAEVDAYHKLMKAYTNAETNRNTIVRRIKEIEETISKTPIVSLDPAELKQLNESLDRANAEIYRVRETYATIKSNVSIFQKTLNSLDSPVCPISEKLICSTDKSLAKAEISELLAKNEAEKKKCEDTIETLNHRIKTINEKKKDFENRCEHNRKIRQMYEQRKHLMDTMPSLPEKPEKPAADEDVAERRKLLENRHAECTRYEQSLIAAKEAEKIEKHISIYNNLLKILSPKGGIREIIVEIALDPLIKQCNKRAAQLRMNFEVGLKADNGVHIVYKPDITTCSEYLPLNSASSGEQAYALFLVMDALNSLTGLGILVLDDLDKLDVNALDSFFSLLSEKDVSDEYNHIFIAMVNHTDSIEVLNKHKDFIDDVITL